MVKWFGKKEIDKAVAEPSAKNMKLINARNNDTLFEHLCVCVCDIKSPCAKTALDANFRE